MTTETWSTAELWRQTLRVRAGAVVGGALAAAAVWVLAVPVLDVDLRVDSFGKIEEIGLVDVLTAAVIQSLVGWVLLLLLEKFTARGREIWTIIALVLLALTMISPIAAGMNTATKVTLCLMHLAVAAVVIPAFRWRPSS